MTGELWVNFSPNDLTDFTIENTLTVLVELGIEPAEFTATVGMDIFANITQDDAVATDSSSEDESYNGQTGSVGGLMSSKMTQGLQLCYRCFTAAGDCCESKADKCSSDTLTQNVTSAESLQGL